MTYSRTSDDQSEYVDTSGDENRKGYHRSKKDNPYLKASQVLNIEDYVDEDTINVIDADTLAFKVASSVETDYIEVYLKSAGKKVKELENVTAFKGRGKTVDPKSWLGNFNITQEAKNLKQFEVDDFEIVPCKRLKHENGAVIDDITFIDSLEVMKYYMDEWIVAIKAQTTINKILPVIGEGKVHRHELLLPEPYKDGRNEMRPLLLKEARAYLVDEYGAKNAKKGFEADEVVDALAKKGYEEYKATGKFSYIKSSPDKDAGNKEGMWFNYDKSFLFKVPQPYLIHPATECVGEIALDKDYIRGVGLKHMCYQLIMGDSADHYGPRKYLPLEVRPMQKYGVVAFYKDFYPLETPKEVLQKLVDIFYEWFPEGVAYTAWNGEEAEFDTLGYIELMFSCAYMKESVNDTTTFEEDLKLFGVSYDHIVSNRITHDTELVEESLLKEIVHEVKKLVEEALEGIESKTGTKPALVEKLESTEKVLKKVESGLRTMFDTKSDG